MQGTLHVRLLQSPEASIRSGGSRSKPPSSSHLVKRQPLPQLARPTRAVSQLLLQIGGAIRRLGCSQSPRSAQVTYGLHRLQPVQTVRKLCVRRLRQRGCG